MKLLVIETEDQKIRNLVIKLWLSKKGKESKEGKQELKDSFKDTLNHVVE